MVLELDLFDFVKLGCPLLDDLPLLPDAEALQVIKADAHLIINMLSEPPSGLQIQLPRLVIPELLMVLLVSRQCPDLLSLSQILHVETPSNLEGSILMLVLR